MHTSLLTVVLFWGALAFAVAAQSLNYFSTPRAQRSLAKRLALTTRFLAAVLSAIAGYRAAIDWDHLPMSSDGLKRGQLWNNGGEPAIVP